MGNILTRRKQSLNWPIVDPDGPRGTIAESGTSARDVEFARPGPSSDGLVGDKSREITSQHSKEVTFASPGASRDGSVANNCPHLISNSDASGIAGTGNSGDAISVAVGTQSGPMILGGQHVYHSSPPEMPHRPTSCSKPLDTALLQQGLRKFYTLEEDWYQPIEGLNTKPYLLEDYYVELQFLEIHRNGFVPAGSLPIQEIFSSRKSKKRHPTGILVTGEAGYGKSTLCKKLVHDWVEHSDYISHFEIVILLRLRGVGCTIEESIVQLCSEVMGFNYEPEKVLQYLNNLGNKFLLILDGYDELSEKSKPSLQRILQYSKSGCKSFLKLATILMTSRPENNLNADERNPLVGQKIKSSVCKSFENFFNIGELTDKAQISLIEKYFKDDTEKAEILKRSISRSVMKLTRSPLLLHIMCYLYEQGTVVNAETDFWEQYLGLIFKRAVSREIGASSNWNEEVFRTLLLQLGEIFAKHLQRKELYIEEGEIQEVFSKHAPFVMSCGLLQKVFFFQADNSTLFETPHKTLMEYLAKTFLSHSFTQAIRDGSEVEFLLNVFGSSNSPIYGVTLGVTTSTLSLEIRSKVLFPIQFQINNEGHTCAVQKHFEEKRLPICMYEEPASSEYQHSYSILHFDFKNDGSSLFCNHFISVMYPTYFEMNRLKSLLEIVSEDEISMVIHNVCTAGFCKALTTYSLEAVLEVIVKCYVPPHFCKIDRINAPGECNVEQICSALLRKPDLLVTCFIFHPLREDQLMAFLLREQDDCSLVLCYFRNDIHDILVKDEPNKEKLGNLTIRSFMNNRAIMVATRGGEKRFRLSWTDLRDLEEVYERSFLFASAFEYHDEPLTERFIQAMDV